MRSGKNTLVFRLANQVRTIIKKKGLFSEIKILEIQQNI